MKSRSLLSTAIALSLLSAVQAKAEAGPYVGVDLSQVTDKSNGSSTANIHAINLKAGRQFNQNFALEARYIFGVSTETVDFGGGATSELELDSAVSLFAKGMLPVSEKANVYAMIGYTKATETYNNGPLFGGAFSDTDDGSSYGIGFSFKTPSNASLNIEWASYLDKDWGKASGLSIGVLTPFR